MSGGEQRKKWGEKKERERKESWPDKTLCFQYDSSALTVNVQLAEHISQGGNLFYVTLCFYSKQS